MNSVISAQISIYPLQEAFLSEGIHNAIAIFKKYNLNVYPGTMSTVLTGEERILWQAFQEAFSAVSQQCKTVMTITISNACPQPSD